MKVFKYKINGSPYRVVVQNSDDTSVELEVNGTPYMVEIEPTKKKPVSRIQRQVVSSSSQTKNAAPRPTVTRTAVAAGSIVVNSPLPGVILDLRVSVGDAVKKGDVLLILEAMKMENNIQAPSDGKVAKVSVIKGDSVLEGAELVVIE
ncbi:MAG: biotin/lipoyl-containing protein [Dysgonamonadaceae bacterium]|jgi:biotin carboxyl carrier protein|nr:biotin/lipoyl-binding protein [Dysgonamonadaceae bacterium]MDD3355440.1 biotin/lipoyl-binding protein [Dysgonamonadaceae bacterium]HUI33856.1 biotin/lipoyl-containing protein [Dysgonamonadaceae bacterium]